MEKIDWKALGFDFSEDSPLQVVIDQMTTIINLSNDMAKTLVANNNKIAAEMQDYKQEAQSLAETVKKVNVENANSSKVLAEAAKQTGTLTTSTQTLTTVEKENDEMIKKLMKEVEALTAAKKKAEEANKNEANSINDLKKQLNEAESAYKKMGDATASDDKIKQAKQVQDLSQRYRQSTKALEEARRATKTISGSYQELTQKVAAAKKELKEMGDGFDKTNPKVQALTKYIKSGSDRLKEFDKALGDNQREVGNYGLAIAGLDKVSAGAATQIKGLGTQVGGLVKNPYILALTALIGTFVALKNAATFYYHATLKGEEDLAEFSARNEAFFSTYKKQWVELGEAITGYFEKFVEANVIVFQHFFQSEEATQKQIQAEKDLLAIERERASLQKEHLRDMVDDAETELDVSRLLEISKDKENYSAQQRIDALRKGNELLRDQEEGDIELAKRDLQLQKDIVAERSKEMDGVFDRLKSISDMSDEEILDIKVKGEEIQKLAQYETALIKVESDASAKRVSRLKAEITLIREIKAEQLEASNIERERRIEKLASEQAPKLAAIEAMANKIQSQVTKDLVAEEVDIRKRGLHRMVADLKAFNAKTEQLKKDQLEKDKLLESARAALQQQAWTTAADLIGNFFEAEDIRIQERMNKLETAQALELKSAGDNADAKAAIESKYAQEFDKIEQEQRANKREQAIADKAFAAFQIVLKTSQAIMEAVAASPLTGGLPFTAIISAIGGLQLASVLSKPIPAFELGTDYSPEGVARVAEKGKRELGVDLQGQATLYDTEDASGMLTYLTKGTKIYDNEETEKILGSGQFQEMGTAIHGAKRVVRRDGRKGGGSNIFIELKPVTEELKKHRPPNYVRIANDIYEVKKIGEDGSTRIRKMSM